MYIIINYKFSYYTPQSINKSKITIEYFRDFLRVFLQFPSKKNFISFEQNKKIFRTKFEFYSKEIYY